MRWMELEFIRWKIYGNEFFAVWEIDCCCGESEQEGENRKMAGERQETKARRNSEYFVTESSKVMNK